MVCFVLPAKKHCPSVSTNERPTLLSRALWQPMREPRIEFAGFNRAFFHPFESAPKVFKQPSSTGTGHLSLGSRGERTGVEFSLALYLPSASGVLNTDKTHFKCANSLFKCVFDSHLCWLYTLSVLKTVFTEYIHRHLSVIHFMCILTQIEWFCAVVNTLDIHSTHYQLFTISWICVYIE